MEKKKYVYWQDENMWIGYFEEFPDYKTQGESLEELKENLLDICQEIFSGNIPCIHKVAELEVA
jgi:predicted RNase H-like HicB family nuclease